VITSLYFVIRISTSRQCLLPMSHRHNSRLVLCCCVRVCSGLCKLWLSECIGFYNVWFRECSVLCKVWLRECTGFLMSSKYYLKEEIY